MPDFVQLGLPSSTASSLEIGSTLVPDQVDWGTDLLNDRYVQTVQSEGGVLAVEQAPNRKITLPFIFKGATADAADQYLSALQSVTRPGNVLDVRPENASWITRFDVEGGRVIAKRDVRYHRQGIIQGTVELSTRPWGYTATWMIAASIASTKPFVPFAGSVIGDLPAHARWTFRTTPISGANITVSGGIVIGQHQMPSYRTIYQATSGGASQSSSSYETYGGNASTPFWVFNSFASAPNAVTHRALFVGASGTDVLAMATNSRAFVNFYWSAASQVGGFPMQLTAGSRVITRNAFPIKPNGSGSDITSGQLIDFGAFSPAMLVTPDGAASGIGFGVKPVFDSTVTPNTAIIGFVDSLIIIPNAGLFMISNPPSNGGSIGYDGWSGVGPATYLINIDTKQQRMWRTVNGGSAMGNDLSSSPRGAWPMVTPNSPSGGVGFVMGALGNDPSYMSIPYGQASSLIYCSVQYQPRWLLFR